MNPKNIFQERRSPHSVVVSCYDYLSTPLSTGNSLENSVTKRSWSRCKDELQWSSRHFYLQLRNDFAICQLDKSMFNKSKKVIFNWSTFMWNSMTHATKLSSFHFILSFSVVYSSRNLSAYMRMERTTITAATKKTLLNPILYKVQINTHVIRPQM